jgi:hypothetical protein
MKTTIPTNNHSSFDAFTSHVNGALAPKAPYTTTPTSRNGDGFHRTAKPTSGDGQWVLVPGGKLPPRAFEVHAKERQRFHMLARTLAMDGNPVAAVEIIGRNIFNAIYGAEQRKFEMEISSGQIEVMRLARDHGKLEADLEHVHATIESGPDPKMPAWFSLKWWAIIFFAICFGLSATGAISNIVCLLLPQTQAFWPAVAISVVWVLLSVGTKIGMSNVRSPLRERLHWAIFAIGICGAAVWLTGLVTGYAMEIKTGSDVLVRSKVAPFVGQLLADFAVGYACLSGVLTQINHLRRTIPNPDRIVLSASLAKLNEETGKVQMELANPEGNLAELHASCECFVAEGVGIIRLRMEDAALQSELQRRRVETQRMLEEFTA